MPGLRAGAAKVDITPDYPVWLDGNPRDRKSEGVHDPISARALVLECADGPIVLVSLELCALPADTLCRVREQVARAAGVPPERQVVACAHVHSAPALYGYFCPREEDYADWIVPRVGELVAEARHRAVPALAGSGKGMEPTISEYRRLWTKDGRIVMNWEDFAQDDILGPAGPADPDVGVVRIDAEAGDTIAVIFNHAGHPNTPPGTWFQISGDYPAHASGLIEGELGGVALFTNGAQGSVDVPAFKERDWEGMQRKGAWLAREVLAVARDARPARGDCHLEQATLGLGKRRVDPEYLLWARGVLARADEHAVNIRDGVDEETYARMCVNLADSGPEKYDVEMMGLALGGAAFVTVPGELFTEIGLRIKRLSPLESTFIIGLANGCLGYIPTGRAIREGGYATRPGSSCLIEDAEDLIVEHALMLLGRLHARMV